MDPRQRGRESCVSFVGDQHDRAGFGHGEISAGNSRIGRGERGSQAAASVSGKLFGVDRQSSAGVAAENLRDLRRARWTGGADQVRGAVAGDLDDIFAEVGFDGFDSARLRVRR